MTDEVEDPIAAYAVGITALQLTLQELSLKRIALKIIEGLGDPLVEHGFPFRHAADDALGLVGELKLIDQGRL